MNASQWNCAVMNPEHCRLAPDYPEGRTRTLGSGNAVGLQKFLKASFGRTGRLRCLVSQAYLKREAATRFQMKSTTMASTVAEKVSPLETELAPSEVEGALGRDDGRCHMR